MKALFFSLLWLACQTIVAQPAAGPFKNSPFTQAEIEQMSRMSEAELDTYRDKLLRQKQSELQALNSRMGSPLAGEALPGGSITFPEKENYLLAAAEKVPTDRTSIIQQLGLIETAVVKLVSADVRDAVALAARSKPTSGLQADAIGAFYSNRPEVALLLLIHAVRLAPDSIDYQNNLAAFMNLTGLQAQAIPVLKAALARNPRNATLLNNLGQAYFGLGDLVRAEKLLRECLEEDELNPEANHSLALMLLRRGAKKEAVKYITKEKQVINRPGTDALVNNQELRDQLNYYEIYKAGRGQWMDQGSFGDIGLSKFEVPPFPRSVAAADNLREAHLRFRQNVLDEQAWWLMRGGRNATDKSLANYTSVYRDRVLNELEDLQAVYAGKLQLTDEDWRNYLTDLMASKAKALANLPESARTSQEICDAIRKINDEFVSLWGDFLDGRHAAMNAHWKIYINSMVDIISHDPTYKGWVFAAIQQYFGYLSGISGQVDYAMELDGCQRYGDYSGSDTLTANHLLDFMCKQGIKGELPFGIAKGKLNCEGLELSATVELLKFGYEKKFRTGTSTVWVGGGVEAKYKDIFKLEALTKIYVSWDRNNKFSDAGVSNSSKISIDKVVSSEFGTKFGVNSGFTGGPKVEVKIAGPVNKYMGYEMVKSSYKN